MSNYTIIEPSVEFIAPDNYLEFLEVCTRVCYKSEAFIKPGSAEKLLNKVVKNYEHYSVTEHANALFRITELLNIDIEKAFIELSESNPLLRKDMYRTSMRHRGMLMSGNVRMWMEFLENRQFPSHLVIGLKLVLHKKWPFFFPEYQTTSDHFDIEILDENPITNKDDLATCMMKRHMTLTVKFTGSRTFSHQLVRHRMFAFSQESQRYVNYGKKGFQIIVPPSIRKKFQPEFAEHAADAYEWYLFYLDIEKMKPEDARFILPNCSKTEIVTTGTLANWLHVIEHRGHNDKAQWEIRQLMLDTEKIFQEQVPKIFK